MGIYVQTSMVRIYTTFIAKRCIASRHYMSRDFRDSVLDSPNISRAFCDHMIYIYALCMYQINCCTIIRVYFIAECCITRTRFFTSRPIRRSEVLSWTASITSQVYYFMTTVTVFVSKIY